MELPLRLTLSHQRTIQSEAHEHHVAILLTEGTAVFECRGATEVTAPSLYFIPARAPHRVIDTRDGAGWALGGVMLQVDPRRPRLDVPLSATDATNLSTWFAGLERESADGRPFHDAAIGALRTLVTVEIARACRAASARPPSRVVAAAAEAVAALTRGPVKPRDIARAVGVTAAHLSHEMRRVTGCTVSECIAEARVARVKELLLASDRSLAGIAEELNYSDVSQLAREFRRVTGIAPGAWRANSA